MQIRAYPFPAAVQEKQFFNNTVVVIDVLRATTSMLEALLNGASQLIPARDAGEAKAFAGHFGRDGSLLAGESGGIKMPGFDLGNSPLEYTRDVVSGKTVVFCTTNGTNAIHNARTASNVLLGCMRNRAAVASRALSYGGDIMLLCAGTHGEASMDDMIALGGIYRALLDSAQEQPYVNDFARVCGHMYDLWENGGSELIYSTHYNTLFGLGFEADLKYCFEKDASDGVPVYENGVVRLEK